MVIMIYHKKNVNVADPSGQKDATTKSYTDDENAKQDIAINQLSSGEADKSDVDNLLPLDGSNIMTRNLNMNNHAISGLRWPYGLDNIDTNMPDDSQVLNYK